MSKRVCSLLVVPPLPTTLLVEQPAEILNQVYFLHIISLVLAYFLQQPNHLMPVYSNTQGRPKRFGVKRIDYTLLNSPQIE